MAEMTSYEHGVPSWADLGTTDQAATAAFYTGLFGWEATEPNPEAGGYQLVTYKGKQVVGLGPSQGGPAFWTTYVNVDDVDDIAERVVKAGGSTMVPPMDVLTAGRMALFTDPTGAVFGAWQAGDHKGAQIVNETNTMCWNELASRDLPAATSFYSDVFGWTMKVDSEGDFAGYTQFQVGDRVVGGMMPMPDMVPAEVPSHWMVYFTVDDVDATVATATKLGGALVNGPIDMPSLGRFAIVSGPSGEVFSVIRFLEQPS
jgi:predicted enzyme related to lactoylglutathione lyase